MSTHLRLVPPLGDEPAGAEALLEEFRPDGPLPGPGITVLEASAGTGKTAALAGLVTRFVAEEGVPLARVLAVTFTRMATVELRDRVRRQLNEAATFLRRVEGGGPVDASDATLLQALAATDVALRRGRLERALAELDTATITTIHGFCRQALLGLGLAADHDPAAQLTAEPAQLIDALLDDVLAATDPEGPAPPSLRDLADGVRKALTSAAAVLGPTGDVPDAVRLRVELVEAVRTELTQRLAAAGTTTYDGLVSALDRSLGDAAAVAQLAQRYDVVLVDEFQDTDTTQWHIFRAAFTARDDVRTVLIGDPKQAIYAWRGADVDAYLDATQDQRRQTLDASWRSDERLLDALNALLAGAELGHDRIPYRSVRHAPGHEGQRISHPSGHEVVPLEVRIVQREGGAPLTAEFAVSRIAADVAERIDALLRSGCTLARGDGSDPAIRADDLAVLTRTNAEARLVQRKLAEVGIPAVLGGAGEVLDSPAAAAWQALLAALERPSASGPARLLALTPLVGWGAERVATASEEDWDGLHERLHDWAAILAQRGVAAAYRAVARSQDLAARVLRHDGGERLLADLDHVAEILDAEPDRRSPVALAAWLREERDAARARADLSAARRLETDAPAVTVLTVHRAKGLEFGVVYVPFLATGMRKEFGALVVRDPGSGRRMVHVGGPGAPDRREVEGRAAIERYAEEQRLLYVALTRARHRAIVWWAPVRYAHESPLAAVLFGRRDDDGRLVPGARCQALPPDERAREQVDAIAARCRRAVRPSWVALEPAAIQPHAPAAVGALDVAEFARGIDRTWRRASYTALVAGAHAAVGLVPGEPEQRVKDDEPEVGPSAVDLAPPDPGLAAPPPLAAVPGGASVGTFVHAVFEHVDFASAGLDDDLRKAVAHHAALTGVAHLVGDGQEVAADLLRVVETPLGALADGLRLRDVARPDRRDELWFELPLATAGEASVSVHAFAALLEAHLPAGDPLRGYASLLRADPTLGEVVRGYLGGAIDLVLRLPGAVPRFAVVDYKTTTLGPAVWDYRPSALRAAMVEAHYPLQALLYVVALHRFLRWRLAGYDPASHLAGVLYLFVRGMAGASTPQEAPGQPCGVFAWAPPAGLVTALSDLLDGGAR